MKLGIPALAEAPEPEACAKLCLETGAEFAELNMNLPIYQPGYMKTERLKRISEETGIYFTLHLDERLDVCDFNPYVAGAYRHTVREAAELAIKISAPVLNMHMAEGVHFTLPDKKLYLYENYRERYLGDILSFRSECEDILGGSGVKICIENCEGYLPFQVEALDILLGSPVFGLTFDIGHGFVSGSDDEKIIMARKNKLCHMHIHDAKGKNAHLSLGSGELNIEQYLKLAKELGIRAVIEVKTEDALRESMNYIKEKRV